jgi:methylmalonyl-CoA mutase
MSFFFAIGMNFFTEVCKLRAARLLWSKIVHAFGAKDASPWRCARTARRRAGRWPRRTPTTTSTRTCLEALAAVLGGTQSLHTNALDEAIALPTDFSARIARNTQLILQEESHVTHVADPLAGSHYVEWLTDQLAPQGLGADPGGRALGGMTKAIEAGLPKLRIEEAAARRQAAIDCWQGSDRRRQQVPAGAAGTARHPLDRQHRGARGADRAPAATEAQPRQARCAQALAALTEGCARHANLLALAVTAVQIGATVGEVSSRARSRVWPPHRHPRTVAGVYAAAGKSMTKLTEAQRAPKRLPRTHTAAGRASWSPRWARTATTAARA